MSLRSTLGLCLASLLLLVGFALGVVYLLTPPVPPQMPPPHTHFEAGPVENKDVRFAHAVDYGYPATDSTFVTVHGPEDFPYKFPYLDSYHVVTELSFQVVVRQKLPDANYVALIYNPEYSIVLPLEKKAADVYTTPPFLFFSDDYKEAYYRGVRVLKVHMTGKEIMMDADIKKIVPDAH